MAVIRRLTRSGVLWMAIFLWLLYFPIMWILEAETLFALLNGIAVSMGVAVLIAYWEGIVDALTTRRRDAGHILLLGVICGWAGLTARQLSMWVWRWLGEPSWLINHEIFGFLSVLVISAGALHLSAKGAIDGKIPRKNFVTLGVSVAVGIFIAFLTLTFWPEPNRDLLSPTYDVDMVQPYLDFSPIPPLEIRPIILIPPAE